ncbi:MAG: RNase adapter RapZ [Paracoccaceae bacterium]|nr:RNase adapter RapZ [Loktanella sp.]
MTDPTRQTILLVTGPSGAGRSTAINALEDLGYETIDNMPLSLMPQLLVETSDHPLAVGVDVRNRDFSADALLNLIEGLNGTHGDAAQVLYIDAEDDMLVRRFSETRRRHPLAASGTPLDGIIREKELLIPIRARADILLDSSQMTVHDMRSEMERLFADPSSATLSVSVQSFSYKRGLPRGLDMVFDCRFLRNPHWETALRGRDGRDTAVSDYVRQDARFAAYFEKVHDLLRFQLPAHHDEGRAHVTIGFGCTGGQHRSVALAETLGRTLADAGWQVSIRHREMERRDTATSAGQQGQAL